MGSPSCMRSVIDRNVGMRRMTVQGPDRPGALRWPPTPSSAKVKERVKLHLCTLSGLSWTVLRWTSPFFAHIQIFARYHYSNLLGTDSLSFTATVDCFKELEKFWAINFESESNSFRKDAAHKWVLTSTAHLEQGTFWHSGMSAPRKLSSGMHVAIECPLGVVDCWFVS